MKLTSLSVVRPIASITPFQQCPPLDVVLDNVQTGDNCNMIETRSVSHISFENTHTNAF
jgi:hypothetical protein